MKGKRHKCPFDFFALLSRSGQALLHPVSASSNQAIGHWPLAVSKRRARHCPSSQLIRGEKNATVNSFWTRSPQRQVRVWPKSPRPRADGERSLTKKQLLAVRLLHPRKPTTAKSCFFVNDRSPSAL